MTITYRDGVAIAQFVFFIPAGLVALFLASRHGFGRLAGWFYLVIFSLLRIVGSIFRFIAISKPSTAVIVGEIICGSVGLSPLVLILVALLGRVNMFTERGLPQATHRLVQLLSLAGIVLGIVGGTSSIHENTFSANSKLQAASIIFTVVFGLTVILLAIQTALISRVERGERRLLLCVAICCPIYLIRLVYSLLGSLGHVKKFNLVTGNVTLFLCLAVLEEFAIVIICLGFGLTLRKVPKGQVEEHAESYHMAQHPQTAGYTRQTGSSGEASGDGFVQQQQYQNTGYPQRTRRTRRTRRARGPIGMLIGAGMDLYKERSSRTQEAPRH